MTFIYILYFLVIWLIFILIYLMRDCAQTRKKILQNPEKLQRILDEKNKVKQGRQQELSVFLTNQKHMQEKMLQIDLHLKHLKETSTETELDLQTVKIMELNTQFTMQQIHKSINFMQEMKSEGNK